MRVQHRKVTHCNYKTFPYINHNLIRPSDIRDLRLVEYVNSSEHTSFTLSLELREFQYSTFGGLEDEFHHEFDLIAQVTTPQKTAKALSKRLQGGLKQNDAYHAFKIKLKEYNKALPESKQNGEWMITQFSTANKVGNYKNPLRKRTIATSFLAVKALPESEVSPIHLIQVGGLTSSTLKSNVRINTLPLGVVQRVYTDTL